MKADVIMHNPDNVMNTSHTRRLFIKITRKIRNKKSFYLCTLKATIENIKNLVQGPAVQCVQRLESQNEFDCQPLKMIDRGYHPQNNITYKCLAQMETE